MVYSVMIKRFTKTLVMTCIAASHLSLSAGTAYDPFRLDEAIVVEAHDFSIQDTNRDRTIPIRVYLDADASGESPVILFSHGLGGSREGNSYLGNHWAARGYVCVFLQHVGSDASVWEGRQRSEILSAMREAANYENMLLRLADVPAVLDQLEVWNEQPGHQLEGRMRLTAVGMSGHSFGAKTTQAVSGQRPAWGKSTYSDSRIAAAVVMSPSSPKRGTPEHAFGEVTLPWLLMTGTEDVAIIGDADMESRLAVYPALPVGGKYELVLDGAKHSAFSERDVRARDGQRNPNHHHAILGLSTAFWDAYLQGESEAETWLKGEGAKSVLESGDRWQWK